MKNFKYSTGAFANLKDNRDIKYSDIPMATAIELPAKHITDVSMIPIMNQGNLGTCVAHAIAFVKMYQEYKETGVHVRFSRRFLYSVARKANGYVPTVEGLYPRDGAKTVQTSGILEPDAIDDNTLPHALYEAYAPTGEQLESASKWVSGFAAINGSNLEEIKQAIIKEGVIAVALAHQDQKWSKTGRLSKPTAPTSRHYVVIIGYEDTKIDTIFYFANSWGNDWGKKGIGNFKWSDYQTFLYDAIVFTDVPNDLIQKAKDTQYIFTTKMELGVSSPEVKKLQERLRLMNYYTYPQITGYFGDVTKTAVIAYQRANGIIPADGIVGPKTRDVLNRATKKVLKTSASGLQLIKDFEWLHDGNTKTKLVEPLRDPVGYPTIGWGSRYGIDGKEITMETPAITLGQCDELLARDVGYIEIELQRFTLNQNQFDALVSLCYNIGIGAFRKSTIAKVLLKGETATEDMFTVFVKARNQKTKVSETLKGLVIRRKKEYRLFVS